MTALKPKDVSAALKARPKDAVVILLHGQDQGLIRERAAIFGKQIVEDLNDPFNAIELADADLGEPDRLSVELAALSFMGGERLIRIRTGSDTVAKAVDRALTALEKGNAAANGVVVIEAGELRKTNKLRKRCEQSSLALSIGCYAETGQDLLASIKTQLAEDTLTIDDEAMMLLISRLGEDRGITRTEVEKLAVYKLADAGTAITAADVRDCLADSAADTTFEAIDAMLRGQTAALSLALHAARRAAVSPLGMLRIAQGRLLRLFAVQSATHQGLPKPSALKKAQPPIFFTEQRSFEDQLTRWPLTALEAALRSLMEAELSAKQTGMPQTELVERTFLRLAAGAARRA